MLIIGERINTSRENVRIAVEKKDVNFIQELSRKQVAGGANMLDVNCGTSLEKEAEDLAWLVKTVQKAVDVQLCIDSPSPESLAAALPAHKGKALVNSITLEKARYEKILPLIKKYGSSVVALTMDEKHVPATADERFSTAKKILEIAKGYGIAPGEVYFDPMVKPLSSSPVQAKEFLSGVRLIKSLNGAKIIGGLSNISFGLPERSLLNSTFLAMARCLGLDAAIIDPLNKKVMSVLRAAEAIMGHDNYCKNYITAYRQGSLTF